MRRYKRGKKIICWLLMAAMVLTGSSMAGLEVKAAETTEQSQTIENDIPETDSIAETTEAEEESSTNEGADEVKETETDESASAEETSEAFDAVPVNDDTQTADETESVKAETEVDEPVLDGEGTYGELLNGDFENGTESWTIEGGLYEELGSEKGNTDNQSNYLYEWVSDATDISLSQTISNIKPSQYKVSVYAGGTYEQDTITLQVKSGETVLASKSLGAGTGWGKWQTITTDAFEITEADASSITVEVAGTLGASKDIHIDDIVIADQNATHTKAELEAKYNEYSQYAANKYTADSWAVLEEKLTAAKTIIDDTAKTDEANAAEITKAYNALVAAAEALVYTELQFDLYVKSSSAVSVSVWTPGGQEQSWMTAEEFAQETERPQWYKSKFTIAAEAREYGSEVSGFGFELTADGATLNTWGNAIFTQLLSGESTAYYLTQTDGTWSVTTDASIMNTVSFNIYSPDAVPYLIWIEGEETKSLAAATDSGAWYTVTDFVVPESGFSIHAGAEDGTEMSVITKDGAVSCSDETGTLFSGYTWYVYKTNEDGTTSCTLCASKNDAYVALGITTENLQELITEAKALSEKAELMYTEASRTALQSAIEAGETLLSTENPDAEEVTNAYLALAAAMDAMEQQAADVTFYYYNSSVANPGIAFWEGGEYLSSDAANAKYALGDWETTVYSFTPVEDYEGWYSIHLVLQPDAENKTKGFGIYSIDAETGTGTKIADVNNTDSLFGSLVSYESAVYVLNNGVIYKDFAEATIKAAYTKLTALYETIKSYEAVEKGTEVAEDKKAYTFYTGEEWDAFAALRNVTAQLVEAGIENLGDKTEAEVYNALLENYNAVSKAAEALIPATLEEAEVNVTRVPVSEEFITGADISSYVSLVESGVVFKDANGNPMTDEEFFAALKAGGTNWVRIRIWDNPYDSSGNGYGGGNNDIEKAIIIGKLATNAGMRVLIDFHYSDFWVDPSKYDAPKAWQGMDIETKKEALYNHTYDNLVKLKEAGVDVGMVQVGNETNSGIAGEKTSSDNAMALFKRGCEAVRDFSEDYLGSRNEVLVAVHFADPQDGFDAFAKRLKESNVDYDVFASSYYPMWHETATAKGDTSSLTSALSWIASEYGKMVMVAETSWPNTWEDGDGHGNSAPKTSGQNLQYDISLQGQLDEMRAVVSAVSSVENGIGVFYWEPAWVPVAYAYNDDGTLNEEQYKKNQETWEKYGSGWASSYAAEFDPEDAGLWYGGSAVDNQSWFDFDGTALPSLNTYRYIRNGAYTDLKISGVDKTLEMEVTVGDTITYPDTVTAKFNDGTEKAFAVVWNEEQQAAVSTDKTGEYTVEGVVTCTYQPTEDGAVVTEKYSVILTIKVLPLASSNQLTNAGFETVTDGAAEGWTIKYITKNEDGTKTESTTAPEGSSYTVKPTGENPKTGTYGMNFYRGDAGISMKVCQEITGLAAGTYSFGGYIQGGSAGEDDLSYSYVIIYGTNEAGERIQKAAYRASAALSGWMNWSNPEISGFEVESGDILEVGFEINTTPAGSWGSIDDAYLYGAYGVNVDTELANGTITVSDTVATVGEMVRFVVTPNSGYVVDDADIYLYTLGADNTKNKLTDCSLTVTNGEGTFIMPAYPVYITADIKSIQDIAGEDAENPGIDIAKDVVFEEVKPQIYTGKEIKPEITAAYKNYTLVKNKDYTLAYSNNKETGTATITVTGKGSFKGTKELTFIIHQAADLKNAVITVSGGDTIDAKGIQQFWYTGEEIRADVKVEVPGTEEGTLVTLQEDTDYILKYVNNTKVGTATVYVVAKENNGVYTGSVKKTFKIVKADVEQLAKEGKLTVSQPAGSTYSGKAVQPTITVKYGSLTLKKGKDYTVTYKNNKVVKYDTEDETKTVAAAEVIIKGKGSFKGTIKKNFKISPKSLTDTNVTAKAQTLNYTGKTLKPSVTVTVGESTKLKPNRDYTISGYEYCKTESGSYEKIEAADVKEIGYYRLTLTGKNNYQGTIVTSVFKVTDKDFNLARATVKTGSAEFTGKAVTLNAGTDADVKNGNGLVVYFDKDEPLVCGTDYTVRYDNNLKAGKKAKVTVVGKGEYAGEKTVSFTIKQADISKLAEGAFTAELVADDTLGTTQYYTGYALTPNYKVTAALSGNSVSLIKGTDYTIKFKDNVSGKKQADGTYTASAVITGKGNFKGSYKTSFEITPTKFTDFTISVKAVTYNGKAQKPAITFIHKETGKVFDLKAGTAYKAVYKNNKNVGNADSVNAPNVTLTEKGMNPGGEKQKLEPIAFTITNAKIQKSDVADIAVQTCKPGKAVTPKVTVKVNGRKLKLNTDYKVKYADNTLRGKATVTITGIGNYAGTVEKNFVIK